jgi:hypothetical protein
MKHRFFLNSKITGTPQMYVSAKVWKIQIPIPYEFSWKNNYVNERTQIWKICQLLN